MMEGLLNQLIVINYGLYSLFTYISNTNSTWRGYFGYWQVLKFVTCNRLVYITSWLYGNLMWNFYWLIKNNSFSIEYFLKKVVQNKNIFHLHFCLFLYNSPYILKNIIPYLFSRRKMT
jgi:hypothetical protein